MTEVLESFRFSEDGELLLPEGFKFYESPPPLCSECDDVRWVRVVEHYEITDHKTGEPRRVEGHFYRLPERCLPERYDTMVKGIHGEKLHRENGGCTVCMKYTRAWALHGK